MGNWVEFESCDVQKFCNITAYVYGLYYFSRWEGNIKGFMRLWVNNTGFEMPIYVTHVLKVCVYISQ